MTKQQAYDKIHRYFSRPDAQLSREPREVGGACCYRLKNGKVRKCAIGCLFPDKLYRVSMENKDAFRLLADFPTLAEYFGITDLFHDDRLDFMIEAQVAHDSSASVKGFLRKLDAVARRHKLKVVTTNA